MFKTEISRPLPLSMNRRDFLIKATAVLLCAPPIVRASSLMSVRGIIIPPGALHFGFCDRLCVSAHLPKITELKNKGFSIQEVASELNMRGSRPHVYGFSLWDMQFIGGILNRNEQIKRADAYFRALRSLQIQPVI